MQAPDFSQSFNRYSYAWNNPLKFTDPSGEIIVPLIGVLVGAYLGGLSYNEGELNPIKWNWKAPGTYFGIGIGALLGYVGGYAIVNPGTIKLSVGLTGLGGGIYLVGSGADWSFQWTSPGGGGGKLDFDKPVSVQNIIAGNNLTPENINTRPSILPPTIGWLYQNERGGRVYWDPDLRYGGDLPELVIRPNYASWFPGEGLLGSSWCPCRNIHPVSIPFWWGETDLMANPITKMRVLGYGSEVMWATLAIPAVIIGGGQALSAYSYSGLKLAFWKYPNAGGGGINLLKHGKSILRLDWHRFTIGGKVFFRPHIDIPGFVKHWPWK